MSAVDVLMNEHRLIERVLDAVEAAAHKLERGEPIRPDFFSEAVEFLTGFADGCHHHKEEDVLFPAMVRAGLPREQGPIAVMLAEHEQGRTFIRAIRDAADRLARGDPGAAAALAANARGYVALLRDHIAKEDQVLFPMAAQLLSDQAERETMEGFDRVEREDVEPGAHDRFHGVADRLAREVGALVG